MMTATRQYSRILFSATCLAMANGCDKGGDGPTPTAYRWPDEFGYRVEFVSSTQRAGAEVMFYQESRNLKFAMRDDESYLVWPDSTINLSSERGGPLVLQPPNALDTLSWYLRLGTLGEVREALPACDPAVEACRRTMPSSLPLNLRRLVPRLSAWPAPAGATWVDTFAFDDAVRPGGTRGLLVTTYRAIGDTVIAGRSFWHIGWHSLLRTYLPTSRTAIIESRPIEEDGVTLVDKELMLPAFSAWAGVAILARDSVEGSLATGFRGRAYLLGSAFDSTGAAP